jgi:cytochrome c-type biogenesis protein CcmF
MHKLVTPFAIATAILLLEVYKAKRGEKFKLGFLGYALIFVGFILYVLAFLADDFTLKEVFEHSSKSLDPIFKLSASWSGSGGFIVWWLFCFTLLAFIRRIGSKNVKAVFYYDLTIIALFFIALLNGAFDSLDFVPKNGVGLNPLLKTFWMLLHPPATFIGYALGLLVAIGVFLNEENRFYIGLAWLFVTLANILGGVWSYYTLGWGGYWAWDPVETSLLLPWLSLTAYFHSSELRRSILALTGFSVAFTGFITRGGISPLHGFTISNAGMTIVLLGIPFLIKSVREFKFRYELKPMNVAVYALLGSYAVCFLGLLYQFVFALAGSRVNVSVDYYNFANMPFVIAFLSVLPICKAKIDTKKYLRILAVVFAISIAITIATLVGALSLCNDAPLAVNLAVAFTLPIAIFSLFGALIGLKSLELRLIHVSIPLLVIGVVISWPFAYYGGYESVVLSKGEQKSIDGLRLEFVSAEFHEPKGKVAIDGALEIPEESLEVIKLNVNGREVPVKVRLNLPWLVNGREFVYPEPTIVNAGFDDYYIVIPNMYAFDLFMFTSRYLYEQNQTHMLMFIAKMMGMEYDKFVESVKDWKPSDRVVLLYKRIPFVSLVWLACAIMVAGEILSLVRWRRHEA